MEKLLSAGFIFYMGGAAVQMVGRLPECSAEPYQWTLPLHVVTVVVVPTLLAYLAGVKDGEALPK